MKRAQAQRTILPFPFFIITKGLSRLFQAAGFLGITLDIFHIETQDLDPFILHLHFVDDSILSCDVSFQKLLDMFMILWWFRVASNFHWIWKIRETGRSGTKSRDEYWGRSIRLNSQPCTILMYQSTKGLFHTVESSQTSTYIPISSEVLQIKVCNLSTDASMKHLAYWWVSSFHTNNEDRVVSAWNFQWYPRSL